MRKHFLLLCCFVIAAIPCGGVEDSQAAAWTKKLVETSTLLKNGRYREALPVLRKLTKNMLNVLGPGDETTYVLSIPLIQIALAEAGSGDSEAALWHWHMAQTLYPRVADADLSMFGAPGEFLKDNLVSNPRPESCEHDPDEITPPRVVATTPIKYPEGARQFREKGLLIVHVRVTTDGAPHEPRIVKPLPAPLAYAALEAVRSWRFAPGTRSGQPVEAGYCVTIHYKLV